MIRNPNLFIVGAPKAGTTFLWVLLRDHEEVFFSKNPEKEINFFSHEELLKESYYKDYRISDLKKYLNCFRKATNQKYIVDGSVSYFSYPTVPKKIHNFNPKAKVVIIIRNPIKRAISHYKMDVRMGYANKPLLSYIKNSETYPSHYHQYIGNSMYAKHINNYYKIFGKSNVFVMSLDFIDDELVRLYDFLEIRNNSGDRKENKKANTNKTPKNFISRFLQHNRYITTLFKYISPKWLINIMSEILYKEADEIIISNEEKYILYNLFNHDIKKLKEITNIKLSYYEHK